MGNSWMFSRFFVLGLIVFVLLVIYCTTIDYEGKNFTMIGYEVDGWSTDAIRNISHYMDENLRKIVPKEFCSEKCVLLIIVTSAPSNSDARKAIRETWGKEKQVLGQDISLNFFIGNSLDPSIENKVMIESNQYEDIIQERFIDTYYNLTLKSVFIMKVVANECNGKAKYVLKIDDDMFLHVPKLMETIVGRNHSENVLIGQMTCNATPIRNPFSKWYCPKYMYNQPFYPNFLSGTSYLMSIDVARKLYDCALTTPFIHLEDVYLTGICAKNAGIFPQHNGRFTTGALKDEPCQLTELLTMHQFSPDRIRNTFRALNDPSILKNCNSYERMFNAFKWIETLFTPFSRTRRKRICQ